jgi:hypothetical protein
MQSYWYVRDFGFTGTDAIPTVAAARIDGVGELFGVLGRELRDDASETGLRYYRPLTLVTYSFDFLIGGWSAKGYHLTDLTLHALAVATVFWAARVAFGLNTIFSLLASVIFLLHPAALEVVPAVSRRQEPLLVVGLALSVIGASRVPSRLAWVVVILGSIIAVTSVERGLVIPAVVFAYHLAFDDAETTIFRRVRAALFRSLPSLAVAAAFLLLRAVILEDSRGLYFSWSNIVMIPAHLAVQLVYPQEFLVALTKPESLVKAILLGATLSPMAALVIWAAVFSTERATHRFTIASVSSYFLLCGIAGQLNPWYVYTAVPALALSLATLGSETLRKFREGLTKQGVGYMVCSVALVTLVVYPSPVFHDYHGWRVANGLAQKVLAELGELAERLPDDMGIVALNVPFSFRESDSDAFVTYAAVALLPRTVRVWAEINSVGNEILVVGDSWQVERFRTPTVEVTDDGTIRVYFPSGPAQYHSKGEPDALSVPSSLGHGHEFFWPPRRLTSERFEAYVFDGEVFVPMQHAAGK